MTWVTNADFIQHLDENYHETQSGMLTSVNERIHARIPLAKNFSKYNIALDNPVPIRRFERVSGFTLLENGW